MPNRRYRYFLHLIIVGISALSTGCATIGDQRVDIIYQNSVNAKGGSGDFYLVEETPSPSGGNTPIQWVLGKITNKDSELLGNIVTDNAPVDLLTDALAQEFKSAGYNVIQVNSMPNEPLKALKLKSVMIKLEEVKSLIKAEAKCKIKISVEPWRNGKASNTLGYEADYTDSAINDRDELLSNTMQETIRAVMTRSVPEIIKIIEKDNEIKS